MFMLSQLSSIQEEYICMSKHDTNLHGIDSDMGPDTRLCFSRTHEHSLITANVHRRKACADGIALHLQFLP